MKKILLLIFLPISLFASSLELLEQQVRKDLECLNFPPPSWRPINDPICDVAIIGAGMSGLSLAFALKQQGISNFKVFDAAPVGQEGPWTTTARMKTLRSKKELKGPALNLASLTFHAWYEAQYGENGWHKLGKIPTSLWVAYLQWYKKVLEIPVNNKHRLINIVPNADNTLQLFFDNGDQITTRKVVLATGRMGFGGLEIPAFAANLPKTKCVHAGDVINPAIFTGKQVCIVGVGASAFDIAATALENRASKVQMVMRRTQVPKVNKFGEHASIGFARGYFFLNDQKRSQLFKEAWNAGIPPPQESVERIKAFTNFEILPSTEIKNVTLFANELHIETNKKPLHPDLLVLATGYAIDGGKEQELSSFFEHILLWKNRVPSLETKLGNFPYLGSHFEFLERRPGSAPYLKNIHCFNFASFLSHWRISGDIDCLGVGIFRLAEGLAEELFSLDTDGS